MIDVLNAWHSLCLVRIIFALNLPFKLVSCFNVQVVLFYYQEIRCIFDSIGVEMDNDVFQALWERARQQNASGEVFLL